jgi:hypothetical protein
MKEEHMPSETKRSAAESTRVFEVIRNDGISARDAERYVPGTVVAGFESGDTIDILYRKDDRFFRKVIYKSAAVAWKDLKEYVVTWPKVNRQELSRLKFWGTGGKESDMPTDDEGPPPNQQHSEEPEPIPPERHEKYGHERNVDEFRAELASMEREAGWVLVAYDSIHDEYYGWVHTFLLRTDARGATSGKRIFIEAVVSERKPLAWNRWSGMHADAKYRKLQHKVEPMEPAAADSAIADDKGEHQ